MAYDLTEDAVEKFIGDTRVLEILVTRHRDTGKARGCFVEFHNVDDMKLCLEQYMFTTTGQVRMSSAGSA